MQKNSGDSFAEKMYQSMSDDELQNTLRCGTFSVGALNEEQIELILAEMARRGMNAPHRSAEAAWSEFKREYAGKESSYDDTPFDETNIAHSKHGAQVRIRNAKRRIAVAAAVLVVVLASLMTVQANGVDVFGAIARWTSELFSFGRTEENRGLVVDEKWPEIDVNENRQFTSLQEALDFYGVTEVVAPKCLPGGFALQNVNVETNGVWLTFFSSYTNNCGQVLAVSYNSYQGTPLMYYEKAGSVSETFTIDDNVCKIFENVGNYTAVWITPHFECCVSAPTDAMDIDMLKEILVSMQ